MGVTESSINLSLRLSVDASELSVKIIAHSFWYCLTQQQNIETTWAMSTYESRKSLIGNYIRPLIGDMKLEDVTPRIMDKYYRDLLTVKAVSTKYVKARNEYLTPHACAAKG